MKEHDVIIALTVLYGVRKERKEERNGGRKE